MKLSYEVKGKLQLEDPDLLKVLRLMYVKNSRDVLTAVKTVVEEAYKVTPHKIQKNEDLTKVIAFVDQVVEDGVQALGGEIATPHEHGRGYTFNKRWVGFYPTVKEILDELKKEKKKSIKLDDLYNLLLEVEDAKGVKKFVRTTPDGVETIEKTRVKQYLSPSQLRRVPQTKGVKWDEKTQELRF